MYKYLIDSAGNGLNGLALLALLTMFAVFCIAFVAAFVKKRSYLDHMAALPLDLDSEALDTAQESASSKPDEATALNATNADAAAENPRS